MVEIPDHIPAHMRTTFAMLKQAYPDQIPDSDKSNLMAVMSETGMSDRSVAEAFAYYYGGSYMRFLHDAATSLYHPDVSEAGKRRVRSILTPCGFEEWSVED